jgi:hypothetical protein
MKAVAFGEQDSVSFNDRMEDLLDGVGTSGWEIRADCVAGVVGDHRHPGSHA